MESGDLEMFRFLFLNFRILFLNSYDTSLRCGVPNLARFGTLDFLCTPRWSHGVRIALKPLCILENNVVWFLSSLRHPILALEPNSRAEIVQKIRSCTPRHFHKLRNCMLVNFNVIKKMDATPEPDCPSKIAQIPLEVLQFKHVFSHNFSISELSRKTDTCSLLNHK